MKGKTVLVTGGTSGVGKAAATGLAKLGAKVTIVGSDPNRGADALSEIRKASGSKDAELIVADFSSQAEVRRTAAEFLGKNSRLDVLLNNAGTQLPSLDMTADKVERTTAVNVVAPFLLTNLLLDRLKASAPSRIVITASSAHKMGHIDFDDLMMEKGYGSLKMYNRTKLEDVMITYALARRLKGSGVTVNCFHPGIVRTGLFRHSGLFSTVARFFSPLFLAPEKAATTAIYLASSPEVKDVTGRYFYKSRDVGSNALSRDEALQEKLWTTLAGLCAIRGP